MKTKFKVADILHENGTDFYYLIEELKRQLTNPKPIYNKFLKDLVGKK